MTNPYLNFNNFQDQELLENLINESIEIHGIDVYYIPRTLISPDEILGEDRLSQFKNAYPITGYFENIQQLDGNGPMLERFGMLMDYMCNITFSITTWNKFVGQCGTTTIPGMPMAGDLIYMPLTDQLYEIKFVNDKEPFAQLGRFYTYKCNLSLFQYASEQIDTDIQNIDAFEGLKTLDEQHPERSYFGSIQYVDIVNPGAGYKKAPELEVSSNYGSGALLIPILGDNGEIINVQILDGGSGYAGDDDVMITVKGTCKTEAEIVAHIKVQIESSGDKWASNKMVGDFAEDHLTGFDQNDPFGELDSELVSSNIKNAFSYEE